MENHIVLSFSKSLDENQEIEYKVKISNAPKKAVLIVSPRAYYKKLTKESILSGIQYILRIAKIPHEQTRLHARFNETEYKFSCMIQKAGDEDYEFTERFPEFEIPMDPAEIMLIGKTLLLFAKENTSEY